MQVMTCMKHPATHTILNALDERLPAMQPAQRLVPRRPSHGWLKAVREATGITQQALAKRLGVTRQSYADLETAEKNRAISLASLERAAEAMQCELVYFVVPRPTVAGSYSELARLNDPAYASLRASEHSMALEDQAVGDLPKKPPA